MSEWKPLPAPPDLRRVGIIALDTEEKDSGLLAGHGSGWAWGDGHICGISVAYRAEGNIIAHYFPLTHPNSENFDREQVFQWLRDHIAAGVRIVGQNTVYDFGWLRTEAGIVMPPSEQIEEIGALATMVDENRYQYSLDALCAWRGLPGKDETALLEGCKALELLPKRRKKFRPQEYIWQLPAHFVGPYAEADAANTLALFESLDPVLDQENTRDAYRLEVDLLPMCLEMRRRGIRIDTNAAEQARDLLLAKRDAVFTEISEKLGSNVGMAEIGRTKWLAKTFDQHGICYPRTPKSNPSFTAGNRGWMPKHEHWLPQLIVKADKYNNAAVNFLEKYILRHVVNGRVHAEIHPHRSDEGGTRSLRFSYSSPPLQVMPAHDEELAPLIRGVFSPEEGEVWASCDVSQQEFRFIVHYAARHKLRGAREAVERYRNDPNTDFHAHVSSMTGRDRQISKATNFAKAFGAGVRLFAQMIGKPVSEAEAIYAQYDRELPFVSQLSILCERAVRREGYLTLYDSARRHWTDWAPGGKWTKGLGPCPREEAVARTQDPNHPWYRKQLWLANTRKAMNALIQGSAARHTKLWMRACWQEGVVPLLQMHDALDCSVSSPEQAERVAQLGREAVKLEVPIQVDLAYGRSWGDAKHTWGELFNGASPIAEPTTSVPPPDDDIPEIPAPHICARCKHEPPDGTERRSAYNDLWLHPRCEDELLQERLREEGLSGPATPPTSGNGSPSQVEDPALSGNGRVPDDAGAKDSGRTGSANRSSYSERAFKKDADKPYAPVRAKLLARGYRLVRTFPFTVPGEDEPRFFEDRYELRPKIAPTKERPGKTHRFRYNVNGQELNGTGPRRIIYNWPAIMRAGRGAFVFATEGANKSEPLNKRGLFATAAPYHQWKDECADALAGDHLIYLEDHNPDGGDDPGPQLAAAAKKQLASRAASFRIVPTKHLWKYLPPGVREIRQGDDVKDWLKLGGDPTKLLDICREIPADGIITAEPYQFRAEADIAPWQWLYGRHLLRGEVSGTAAMGGTGKSTLSIVEALIQTSGRALLGETNSSHTPLRVVLINLEDTRPTMDKRITAAMHHYDLTPADIGDRLIVIAKGEIKIKVARQLRSGDVERNEQVIQALTKLMLEHHADVLSIDSFIRTHRVHENDNSAIQEVVECFEDIATEAQCAVHLWHHTRKGGGEKVTIEATRGAIAFVDACRSARVLETMSTDEHTQLLEVEPDMLPPGFYFRAFNGKRNFAPPAAQSDWFKLESVMLLNGDDVGVATAWHYPETWEDVSPEITAHIVDEIERGMVNGQRYSNDNAATTRAAWSIVRKQFARKTESQCRTIIATWIKKGLLYEGKYQDPVYRKRVGGLFARELTAGEEDAKQPD